MTEMTKYRPGTFCWSDLASVDVEASKAFYTGLFGWKVTDIPVGEGVSSSTFGKDGKDVCGLFQLAHEVA